MRQSIFVRVFLFTFLCLLAIGVGYCDYRTGYHVSVVAFYAVPILAGVWFLSARQGYAIALVAVASTYMARRWMINAPVVSELVLAWNGTMRLITFTLFWLAGSTLKSRYDELHLRVRMLSGLLPICNCCKRIRDEDGYWSELEVYLQEHSEASVAHKVCPECSKRLSAGLLPLSSVPLSSRS